MAKIISIVFISVMAVACAMQPATYRPHGYVRSGTVPLVPVAKKAAAKSHKTPHKSYTQLMREPIQADIWTKTVFSPVQTMLLPPGNFMFDEATKRLWTKNKIKFAAADSSETPDSIAGQYGAADFFRKEGKILVTQYFGPSCTLFFFFMPQEYGYRLIYKEARNRGFAVSSGWDTCATSVKAARLQQFRHVGFITGL